YAFGGFAVRADKKMSQRGRGGESAKPDIIGKRDVSIELMLRDRRAGEQHGHAVFKLDHVISKDLINLRLGDRHAFLHFGRPGGGGVTDTDRPDADTVLVGFKPAPFALHQQFAAMLTHLHGFGPCRQSRMSCTRSLISWS